MLKVGRGGGVGCLPDLLLGSGGGGARVDGVEWRPKGAEREAGKGMGGRGTLSDVCQLTSGCKNK